MTREENELLTRVGPGTPMGDLFRQYPLPVLLSSELSPGGPPRGVRLLGEDLVAFRTRHGTVSLMGEGCQHKCKFAAGCTPEKLAGTGVPILFLVGQEDALFPADIVADVHKLVTGSRYVELDQAGHSAYFESPAEFNAAVLRFLDKAGVQ